jgi:hypothetical protein
VRLPDSHSAADTATGAVQYYMPLANAQYTGLPSSVLSSSRLAGPLALSL